MKKFIIFICSFFKFRKSDGKDLTKGGKYYVADLSADPKMHKAKANSDGNLMCPNCKGSKWIEGPGGGSMGNIECGGCGKKYNNLMFYLQEI